MTMKPKTKSAYQRNDENEYKVEETRKSACWKLECEQVH